MLPILLVAMGCFLGACDRTPSTSSGARTAHDPDVVASVEGHAIRVAELSAELERRARGRADAFARPEEREALLDELLEFESVYLRAKEAGFDQKPEIARQIKAFIVDRFKEDQLKNMPESPAVSDAEIEEYYRRHASRFAIPEQVRFAVIQFGFSPRATDEKKAEVLHKAESVLAEARALDASQRAFGVVAQRCSEDQATRYLGGDAGWLARGEQARWDKTVVDAAFALANAGDLSPVIKTPTGCYLLKLIEKRTAGYRPLEEVAEAIRYQLGVEKRQRTQQEFHEAMTAGLKIEINRPLLEAMPAPRTAREAAPPALPGS